MAKLRSGMSIGKWTLCGDGVIGEGGNGVVWQCSDQTDQKFAIKILKSYLLETTNNIDLKHRNVQRLKRFYSEIQFLVTHSNRIGAVPVIDHYLPSEPSAQDRPWYVMPLGCPLNRYLDENPLRLREVVAIFRHIAKSLNLLHALNASHRDIKLDNILIVDNTPLLSDFGLVSFEGKEQLTGPKEFLGPAFYIAPEMMASSDECDCKSADIYSFGKSLWVAGTGQHYPIPGEQRTSIRQLCLSNYISDPRAILLDGLIDKCTRHWPHERPTADEVLAELDAWVNPVDAHDWPMVETALQARQAAETTSLLQLERETIASMQQQFFTTLLGIRSRFEVLSNTLSEAFDFEDGKGNSLTTRLVSSQNADSMCMLWDQFTAPQLWIMERGSEIFNGLLDTVGHVAIGTFTQCVVRRYSVFLISGVQLCLLKSGDVIGCGASVVHSNAPDFKHRHGEGLVVWQESIASTCGSADLINKVDAITSKCLLAMPSTIAIFRKCIQEAYLYSSAESS